MNKSVLACPALFVVFAGLASAQRVETGFLDRSVTVAGAAYRYQVYVPADYATGARWPVILFLHGAGERGTDGLLQTAVGLGPAIRREPQRFPAIAVFPQVPPDSQWVGTPADMAVAALTQTMREFRTDPDRVYLTGLSMGGHGTWYLAYRHPELFAAVVPICGWVVDSPRFRGSVPVVPPDSGDPLPALVRRLAKTPVWIFHGEMDAVVPVSGSRGPAAALEAVSADVRYTEYLGLNHNSWDATYASNEFTRWLFAQRRR
ncbi:MAG: alpha/beta hydrolase-fold protein [Gemmatimonadales bacterium]